MKTESISFRFAWVSVGICVAGLLVSLLLASCVPAMVPATATVTADPQLATSIAAAEVSGTPGDTHGTPTRQDNAYLAVATTPAADNTTLPTPSPAFVAALTVTSQTPVATPNLTARQADGSRCRLDSISPDDTWILYRDCPAMDKELIVNRESHRQVVLTYGRGATYAWSLDGQQLLVADGEFWVHSAADSFASRRLLSDGNGRQIGGPVMHWAPDGQAIAISDRGADQTLLLLKLDGSIEPLLSAEEVGLLGIPFNDCAPAWSPDSHRIAYLAHPVVVDDPALNEQENTLRNLKARQLWVVDLATRQKKLLYDPVELIEDYAWSSDGQKIAVIRRQEPGMVVVLDVQTRQRKLIGAADADRVPHGLAWSPDSRRFVTNGSHPYITTPGKLPPHEDPYDAPYTRWIDTAAYVLRWTRDGSQLLGIDEENNVVLIPDPQ